MSSEPPDENEVLDLAAYVAGSKYRELVLTKLTEGPQRPSNIANAGDIALPHVSRALKELRDRDLVQSYGTDSRAKLYTLTNLGQHVVEQVPSNNT